MGNGHKKHKTVRLMPLYKAAPSRHVVRLALKATAAKRQSVFVIFVAKYL